MSETTKASVGLLATPTESARVMVVFDRLSVPLSSYDAAPARPAVPATRIVATTSNVCHPHSDKEAASKKPLAEPFVVVERVRSIAAIPQLVFVLLVAGASVLVATRVEAADVLQAVIANGPDAGTYQTPESDLICMNSPSNNMYAATWANLDEVVKDVYGAQGEGKKVDAKVLNSASIRVLNPNDPGAKLGDVNVGLRDPHAAKNSGYELKSVPITLTIKGKGADISFDGKTKDGIQLRVTAKCSEMVLM